MDAPIVIEQSFAQKDIDHLRKRFLDSALLLIEIRRDSQGQERIDRALNDYFDHQVIGNPGDVIVARTRHRKSLNFAINSGAPYVHSRDRNAIDDKSPSLSLDDDSLTGGNYSSRYTFNRTDEWKINPTTRVEHILAESDVEMTVKTSRQGDKLVTTISDISYHLDCRMSLTRHREALSRKCVGDQYQLDENALKTRLSQFNLMQFFRSDLKEAAELATRAVLSEPKNSNP